jgi:hypothetical protein
MPKLTAQQVAQRRREVENAMASSMLSGAPEPSPVARELIELYVTGGISRAEYIRRAAVL